MQKKIAILQSNYIPWKGYFDIIASVDEFIFYDDMQYTRRDWRNRNKIKTPQGTTWLTVPVKVKGKYHQAIRETEIDGIEWAEVHWKTLRQHYRRAKHYDEVSEVLEPIYRQNSYRYLSDLNRDLIKAICAYLGIATTLSNSWDYQLVKGKTERLADLCRQAEGAEYVSGPSAKGYIEREVFEEYGVKISWLNYDAYPEYPQLWGTFVHEVTILDLLFNEGPQAPCYIWGWRNDTQNPLQ